MLPGVTVKEGTSIGSMSLCNKTTEEWSVYVGIPARRIGNREKKILELEKQLMEDISES